MIHTESDHELGQAWIGSEGDRRWIVPVTGPVRVGGRNCFPGGRRTAVGCIARRAQANPVQRIGEVHRP